MVAFGIRVQIFVLDFVEDGPLDVVFRAEPVVDNRSAAQLAHLGGHGGALVAGSAVLDRSAPNTDRRRGG